MNNQGFTLVEVALVLLIGGILLASAFSALQTYISNTENRTVNEQLNMIDEALQIYLDNNGIYPCPADMTALTETAEFGIADCATATQASGRNIGEANGDRVLIGAVPVRTLNLPDNFIADVWGHRFTYAVSSNLTDDDANNVFNEDEGRIGVEDSNGNSVVTPAGSAHYVVVSHGGNGLGGTILQGAAAPANACATDGRPEAENCDNDANFVRTIFQTYNDGPQYYDDFVRVVAFSDQQLIPPEAILQFSGSACPTGWSEVTGGSPPAGRIECQQSP